jgi:hypothetical protein
MADLERQLGDLLADERITGDDADAAREFAGFLRDMSERGLTTRSPLPTELRRKHRHLLGLSEAEIDEVAGRRGEARRTEDTRRDA